MLKFLIWFITFAVIGSTIAALIYIKIQTPKNKELVARQLFDPYFDALERGEFETAYNMHTMGYKNKFSLARFTEYYTIIFKEEGKLKRRNVFNALGSMAGYTVDYQLFFEKGLTTIKFGVIKEPDGALKIDSGLSTSGRDYRWFGAAW